MFARHCAVLLLSLAVGPLLWADEPLVPDPALHRCVKTLMAEHGWSSPAEVTTIECHGAGIEQIGDLSAFTALEKLSLYDNHIEQARLSGLLNLKHVNLARNRLKQVAISELPRLEELYLFRNQLGTLTLRNLKALKVLRANSNRMHRFEYEALPALEKIYLFDNEMEHIDIHHLPGMHYMDVRENPMPDPLYEEMDRMTQVTILHDGNADDW